MSVFITEKSKPYYWYSFQIQRRRFFGSTRCKSRKEAERFEALEREKAKAEIKAAQRSRTSLAMDDVCARLWNDSAQHDAAPDATSPLQGQHDDFVFTYRAVYTNKKTGRVRGQRYPLSRNGTKNAWQRIRAKAGLSDFRFHDFRHTFGSAVLRETGNLKLAQQALNHRDIHSTLRYVHVLDEDVADAIERVAQRKVLGKVQGRIRNVS